MFGQSRLNSIEQYANLHQLKINKKKTKLMPINFTRKYDFLPKLNIGDEQLDVIYSSKLLGVILTSDCKWTENTKYIVKKGNS